MERNIIKKIEKLKIKTQKDTGSFKYDWCYDECIDAIKNMETLQELN